MIYELPENKYYKIKPLIHGRKETNVHLLGVIDGNNRGKIYVNDIEEPETALIWAIGCVFAIIGNNTNGDFNQALLPFLRDCLGPESIGLVGGTYFYVPVYEEKWEDTFEKIFDPIKDNKEFRKLKYLAYVFSPNKHAESYKSKHCLPEGYSLRKIDREIMERDSGHRLEANILGDFWISVDAFLKIGFGYCILDGNEVIATCFSGYVIDECHDIVICTYDKGNREKGFGTMVAQAYTEYCIANGLTPFWCTTGDNFGSQRVAEKCGFELYKRRNAYLFPFRILG